LALSPEGTRKRVDQWKTGFYYIAKTAEVPLVLITFDYGKKEIKISEPHWPTDNMQQDFKTYEAFFEGALGKNPDQSFIAKS
jgi:1-acyl-sn-glycerol-3-phosphate acyltransferase